MAGEISLALDLDDFDRGGVDHLTEMVAGPVHRLAEDFGDLAMAVVAALVEQDQDPDTDGVVDRVGDQLLDALAGLSGAPSRWPHCRRASFAKTAFRVQPNSIGTRVDGFRKLGGLPGRRPTKRISRPSIASDLPGTQGPGRARGRG